MVGRITGDTQVHCTLRHTKCQQLDRIDNVSANVVSPHDVADRDRQATPRTLPRRGVGSLQPTLRRRALLPLWQTATADGYLPNTGCRTRGELDVDRGIGRRATLARSQCGRIDAAPLGTVSTQSGKQDCFAEHCPAGLWTDYSADWDTRSAAQTPRQILRAGHRRAAAAPRAPPGHQERPKSL